MSGFQGFKSFQQQRQQQSVTNPLQNTSYTQSLQGQPVPMAYQGQQQPVQPIYNQNINQGNGYGPDRMTGTGMGMSMQQGPNVMPAVGAPSYPNPNPNQSYPQAYPSFPNPSQNPNPGYLAGMAPPVSEQPSYQINAQNYAAYPEYDPEYNVKANISYQHGSVQKGWNDPPSSLALKKKMDQAGIQSSLEGISNPESTIVATLSSILSNIKQKSHPSKQRMIDDTEKRMDSLFDLLASKSLDQNVLASTYSLVMNGIEKRDFSRSRKECGDLLTAVQEHARWIVGLKRVIELYEQVPM